MSLKLVLRPGERLVVNGAILRAPDRSITLEIENRCDLLRESEMVEGGIGVPPIRQVAYLVQAALVKTSLRDELIPDILNRIDALLTVLDPAHHNALKDAQEKVRNAEFYHAYKTLVPLIEHEEWLLATRQAGETA